MDDEICGAEAALRHRALIFPSAADAAGRFVFVGCCCCILSAKLLGANLTLRVKVGLTLANVAMCSLRDSL